MGRLNFKAALRNWSHYSEFTLDSFSADIYIDAENGDDLAGDGSEQSPYATIQKAVTEATVGDKIAVLGVDGNPNSYFREPNLNINKAGLRFVAKPGNSPVFASTHQYTNWSKTVGRTNVYQAAYTSSSCWGVWNSSTLLSSVGDLATCDATTNSFFFDDGNNLLYVNIGGGAPTSIEAYDISNVDHTNILGGNISFTGITFAYGFMSIDVAATGCTFAECTISRWTFYQFSEDSPSFGLLRCSAGDLTLLDCILDGVFDRTNGISLITGANNALIDNCIISNVYHGIDGQAGAGHLVVDCVCTEAANDAFHWSGGSGRTRRCVASDFHHGGFWHGDGGDVRFERCLAYMTYNAAPEVTGSIDGFIVDPGAIATYFHNCVAANLNRTAFNGLGGFYWNNEQSGSVEIRNCIASDCVRGFYEFSDPTSLVFDHNCYFGNGTNLLGTFSAGANDVSSDPLFVDEENDDYSLQLNSPCIDAGTVIAGVTDGYLGNAPDIGYVEVA